LLDPSPTDITIYFTTVTLPLDPFLIDQDSGTMEWFLCMQQGVDFDTFTGPGGGMTMQLQAMPQGSLTTFFIKFGDVNDNAVRINGTSPTLEDDYPEGSIYNGNGEEGYITTIEWSDVDATDKLPGAITFELEVILVY